MDRGAWWGTLLIATGEELPLRGLEGVPGLPGAPQDEAGLTRKFETSHVGGATSGGLRPLVELCVEPAGLCGRCTGEKPRGSPVIAR